MFWRVSLQYIYTDGAMFYFMDEATFEQQRGDPRGRCRCGALAEGAGRLHDYPVERAHRFQVTPPNFVTLEVTETEPGVRGDTASGATKPATVETGTVVKVPLFVEQGEFVRIDTRTGEYVSRAKE